MSEMIENHKWFIETNCDIFLLCTVIFFCWWSWQSLLGKVVSDCML